jgi:hypothetical protein
MKYAKILMLLTLMVVLASCNDDVEKTCSNFDISVEESDALFEVYCSDGKGDYVGYVNEKGNLIIPFHNTVYTNTQSRILDNSERLFVVSDDDIMFGLIDNYNNLIESQIYDSILIIDSTNYIVEQSGDYILKSVNNVSGVLMEMDFIYQNGNYVLGTHLNNTYLLNDENEFIVLSPTDKLSIYENYAVVQENNQTSIYNLDIGETVWSSNYVIDPEIIFVSENYFLFEADEVTLIDLIENEVILSNIEEYSISNDSSLLYVDNGFRQLSIWFSDDGVNIFEKHLLAVYSDNYIYIEDNITYVYSTVSGNIIELRNEFIISFNYMFVRNDDGVYLYDENLEIIGNMSLDSVQFKYLDNYYKSGYVHELGIVNLDSYLIESSENEVIYGQYEDYLLVAISNTYGENIIIYTFISPEKATLFKGQVLK